MAEVIKITPLHAHYRVYVASDAHYWPGKKSTAHRALCHLLRVFYPNVVVFNGDALDGARISKYPANGWKSKPTLEAEIKVVRERLDEIRQAAKDNHSSIMPRLIWTMGNHDDRFDKFLSNKAPQFKGIPGTSLAHFFPEWEFCQRVEIGGPTGVVIKHEFKGGSNPTKANLQASGRSIITGHHHAQNITAFTDLNGTRWGVDAGMLAAVDGPQFGYNEGNPVNWRSGFAVLQFMGSKLMPPSLVTVLDEKKGRVWYDGYGHTV